MSISGFFYLAFDLMWQRLSFFNESARFWLAFPGSTQHDIA